MDNLKQIAAFFVAHKDAAIIYLIFINLLAFFLMGIDKRKAKKGRHRISEKHLFIPVLLGGAFGGIVGMKIFHHKTKKRKFIFGFYAIFSLQLFLLSCIIYFSMV